MTDDDGDNIFHLILYGGLTPMQSLWASVLIRALLDLQHGDPDAVKFFEGTNSNINLACDFLGWDPGRVKKYVRRSHQRHEPCGKVKHHHKKRSQDDRTHGEKRDRRL